MLALRGYHMSGSGMVLFTAILLAATTMIMISPTSAAAYATIKSDYKYGYQGGESEWQSCATTDGEGDCTLAHDYCTNIITYLNGTTENTSPIKNTTACMAGFTNAWNHSCNPIMAKKEKLDCPLS